MNRERERERVENWRKKIQAERNCGELMISLGPS